MVTYAEGMLTPYSGHDIQRRAITDLISIITPRDTPLIARFGIQTSPPAGWKLVNWPSTAVEAIQDELHALTDALNGSITSNATTITVDEGAVFHEGDVIQVDSELMWVTSIANEVLTVTRDFAGTTAATHADNSTVTVITNARIVGDEDDTSSVTDLATVKNYTQILHAGLKVSRTQEKLSQYGKEGEMAFQRMKATQELMRKLERALLRNSGINSGSASEAALMGGLPYWINSSGANTVSAGGAVTQADFEDALEAAYNDGGNPRVAVVSPANMQVIKNFYDSSSYLRVERTETTVGMTIETILTPFGEVELLMDRHATDSEIFIIDPDHFAILAFEPVFNQPLAVTGDYIREQIIGEFTCLVRHPLQAHAAIISIS